MPGKLALDYFNLDLDGFQRRETKYLLVRKIQNFIYSSEPTASPVTQRLQKVPTL